MFVGHSAEKFNIESNDHGCTHKDDFSVLTGNTLLGKFDPKKQNCRFKLKFGTYNLLHIFLEKLIFPIILLFLALSPIFNVGFHFSDLLTEQETFLEPLIATLSWRGEASVDF